MASCFCAAALVASYGVRSRPPGSQRDGTTCLTARVGPQLAGTTCVLGGVDRNGAFSRARGQERRRSPLSPCFGVAAAAVRVIDRVSDQRRRYRFWFSLGAGDGSRGMVLEGWRSGARLLLRPRWSRARGWIRGHPARNEMALRASLREWDLNWLARHAFWAALTVMAPSRAREGRSGADRRSLRALGLRRLPSG